MSRVLLNFAVPDGAGAMRMMYHFALALRRADYEVFLAYGDSTARTSELPPAATRLLDDLAEAGVVLLPLSGFRKKYCRQLERQLRGIVNENKIEGVVCFHPLDMKYALRVARHTKCHCIVSMQNRQVFWGSPLIQWVKKRVFRRLLSTAASSVVCTSESIRDEMIASYGVSPENSCVIPNGIPVNGSGNNANRSGVRSRLGIADDQVMLVNTGRLDIQKGQDILLESLSRVSDDRWVLMLIGSASHGRSNVAAQKYEDGLRTFVEQNGWQDRVKFLGWRDDVDEILGASDIYVHSARWEGPAAPLAVMEAMAAAKPVVLTDCSGRPEGFVDGAHGYVVPSENPEKLSLALQEMFVRSHSEYQMMGQDCRRLAETNFEIGGISNRFVEEVSNVLARAV